jgi:PKD repeat protein
VPIVTWDWDFGDGGTASINNPIHSFDTIKVYKVIMKVNTVSGCGGTIEKFVKINKPPVAYYKLLMGVVVKQLVLII